MRTSEEIYHRVRWDPRLDPARFVLGVSRRGADPKRIPLPAFVPGGEIPWHRVLFIEADGEIVWDRATRVDRLDTAGAGRARLPRLLKAPFFAAREAHAWDATSERWRPAVPETIPAPPASTPTRVRVLTWNTLWDRYDSHLIDTDRRRPLLLRALAAADADVIALQEVEVDLLTMLTEAPWVRAAYTIDTAPTGRDVDESGLVLLSRLPVREAARHALGPHKAVAAITVETFAGSLVVATTHLTSDHTDRGADRRLIELGLLAEGFAGVPGELVVLGDFNESGDGPAVTLDLRDAWTDAHGVDDDTPTYDPTTNPLAAIQSLSGRAARLDRVLVRTGRWRAGATALYGDTPSAEGLHPSDHFGVRVDLATGTHTPPATMDAAPTARTALAWIPPRRLWPAIQDARRAHDPRVDRWPPHVNVLFGFVPEAHFDRALSLLAAAATDVEPFTTRLDGVHTFGQREDATLWLDPAATNEPGWAAMRRAAGERFPTCRGRADGYTPHLTLGRSTDPQRVAAECAKAIPAASARVGEWAVLSRRGDEPMTVRATIALGTGDVRWMPETDDDTDPEGAAAPADPGPATRVTRRVTEALVEGVVHVAGSRRMGCAAVGADLDLVAVLPGGTDIADIRARVAAALPDAGPVRVVTGARVPGLRLSVDALTVDVIVVDAGNVDPAEAVARRAELGDAAAIALSAVGDADAILDAVGDEHARFSRLARRVKAWARVRGLDSAPFGGLPGLAWCVLAARTAHEARDIPDDDLLRHFFGTWAAWDWRTPIALTGTGTGATPPSPVSILTPSSPVRSCTEQVGVDARDLLTRELYRAWEHLEDTTDPDPRRALLAPPPLHRRHAAWAVVEVRPVPAEEFTATTGRVRGRVRALLSALREAGITGAHAWPRPFATAAGGTHYAVGLGPTPPDADTLARVTENWAKTLPGVHVTRADNGAVPSLR